MFTIYHVGKSQYLAIDEEGLGLPFTIGYRPSYAVVYLDALANGERVNAKAKITECHGIGDALAQALAQLEGKGLAAYWLDSERLAVNGYTAC